MSPRVQHQFGSNDDVDDYHNRIFGLGVDGV
ncbi:hypothetical protein L917_20648 [Phytophthora nicotianae]|uniref:Uncharacterized protein n=1 Tax=Phytophthora nicotianae TaxID=4792 RepID=W2K060_PHYNI|nr:hypothetical protein L917_20648 [Phytophthora nicotianae]